MKNIRILGIVAVVTLLEIGSLLFPAFSQAANLTSARDTLQSSRMSFYGRVKSPSVAGSSHVWIYTSASSPANSISTAGLKPGDIVKIGGTTDYTIASIIDADEFTTTTVLGAGDADDTDTIVFKSIQQHIITFNTASAIDGGFFRILIPASTTTNANDTIPDVNGFDFNSGVTATASARTGYGGAAFTTGVATASGGTNCPSGNHCFEFHYIGAGGVGTGLQFFLGLATGGSNSMIAPAPSDSRVAYTADTYTFKIQNFPNGSNPTTATATDDVQGKIAVIESVRVTATVDPSITFKIEGGAAGTHCGLATDVVTTETAVPFGTLVIDTFKQAHQQITVSTNAVGGYSVTAIENERLSNLAGSPSYIPNTTCDTSCTFSGAGATWATASTNAGFGYTMAVVSGTTPTVIPIAAAFRPFASLAANEPPTQIMSYNAVSSTHVVDVCYQISVDATQAAGNYENQITYTATATF